MSELYDRLIDDLVKNTPIDKTDGWRLLQDQKNSSIKIFNTDFKKCDSQFISNKENIKEFSIDKSESNEPNDLENYKL